MKLVNLLFVAVFVSSSQVVLAENPFTEAMDTVKDMIKGGTDVAKEGVKAGSDAIKETSEAVKDATDSAQDTAKDVADKAQDVAKDTTDAAKDVADKAQDVAKDSVEAVKEVSADVTDTVVETSTESLDGVIVENGSIVRAAKIDEEDSDHLKWSKELINAVEEGDVKNGEVLAKEAKCSKCHGDTGVSEDDDIPSIAGQISAYSYKQLHDYKVKLRDDRDMLKKVKKLSDQDMMDISAWYATQKPETMAGNKEGGNIPVLANKGDKKRFLIACDTCHDEDAMKRGFQTPVIEGQKPEHFVETMLAFKEGERVNDHYKLMQSIASKLTEDEIKELADYYAAAPAED